MAAVLSRILLCVPFSVIYHAHHRTASARSIPSSTSSPLSGTFVAATATWSVRKASNQGAFNDCHTMWKTNRGISSKRIIRLPALISHRSRMRGFRATRGD
ncbi:hypothetical protein GQ43DRAFT_442475 [Delitschia confertaspora ATCC 74209]|uniref:Uncharacterized protein n=1 Tax=Delitschia confertaspora ATCC 74209 TaxID=1513339 RepID=A0A9P4JHQ9_9PLEO|nr:hypothetical protein GQ43DRAFT_442475 [Delitschia confertaspora ATCC 74209]